MPTPKAPVSVMRSRSVPPVRREMGRADAPSVAILSPAVLTSTVARLKLEGSVATSIGEAEETSVRE